jgi:hypothetical protein
MAAGLPVGTVWAIEAGVRAASPGTVWALAEALAAWSPSLGSTEDVLQVLLEHAGPQVSSPERDSSPRVTARETRSRRRRRGVYGWLDARGARGWQSHR